MPIVFDNVTISGGGITIFPDAQMIIQIDKTITNYVELNVNTTGVAFIDWGDGTGNEIVGNVDIPHTYATNDYYTIKISGIIDQYLNLGFFRPISIDSWGTINPSVIMLGAGTEFTNIPNYLPTNINHIIIGPTAAYNFNDANVSSWNTSNLTSLAFTFASCSSFNQPIDHWDVGNVTNMKSCFTYATNFNQPLNNWNISNVENMDEAFTGTSSFNQPLNNWNTANVTAMGFMFAQATIFDQDLSGWCVTNIASEPIGFAIDSALDANNYPVWGTCP